MKRRTVYSAALVWMFVGLQVAVAGIVSRAPIHISFDRNVEDPYRGGAAISKHSRLSPHAKLKANGLVLEGEGKGWVESETMAVGLAYRGPCGGITALFDVMLKNKEDKQHLKGYVRYSCDRLHWSSWELPKGSKSTRTARKPLFLSDLRVPREECTRFSELAKKVEKPEEGAIQGAAAYYRWLAERSPEIFAQVIPSIGYVQLKIVNHGPEPVTLQSIDGSVSWHTSGLSRLDEPVDWTTKWNFDLRPKTPPATSQPTTQPAEPSD
ncbi:MAG: hypothetical protein MI923_04570 [Phycisphaerales bacterium]|nr:hypothetical protein [Phycisphaerales bacterium]